MADKLSESCNEETLKGEIEISKASITNKESCDVFISLDDVFKKMDVKTRIRLESAFLAKGRGRRADIPHFEKCTHSLLLQIYFLKSKNGKSWEDVHFWVHNLFSDYPPHIFRAMIENVVRSVKKCANVDIDNFLDTVIDLDYVGDQCNSVGITRKVLMGVIVLVELPVLTKGILHELYLFCKRQRIDDNFLLLLLNKLKPGLFTSIMQLSKALKAIHLKFIYLNKSKSRNDKATLYLKEEFVSFYLPSKINIETTIIDPNPSPISNAINIITNSSDAQKQPPQKNLNETSTTDLTNNKPITKNITSVQKLQEKLLYETNIKIKPKSTATKSLPSKNVSTLNKHETSITTTTDKLEEYKINNNIENLTILIKDKETSYSILQSKYDQLKTLNNSLDHQIINCKTELKKKDEKLKIVKKNLHDIKSGAFYQRVRRRKKYLVTKEKDMANFMCETEKEKLTQLKNKLKVLKKNLHNQKTLANHHLSAKTTIKKDKAKLEKTVRNLEAEIVLLKSDFTVFTRTNSKGNKFASNIELCVMELVGELEVSSTKCSRVIQTVSKWLFNQIIDTAALPSQSTVINMMDRAQVLSKYQVAQELLNTQHFDIHSDGTSRDHVKILGQQITIDDGRTLSTGFSTLAKEDSCTLLDAAVGMLTEVADMHTENNVDKEKIYKEILSKLFALMADRANVNKAFYKNMQSHINAELTNTTILHFLHCNAHFLLGLSTACEKALKQIESKISAAIGHPLGRDNDPKFKCFKNGSESSGARYIRTACDVFGPRGDEKNGCKQEWKAYCETKLNKISRITSFRMNRFNNFFEGAAALVFHKLDIQDFLSHFKENLNLKLISVLSDSLSKELQAIIRAVGILYYKVTGPFWKMLHGDVEYVDLHLYVQSMLTYFKGWSKDATQLLHGSNASIFPSFDLDVKDDAVFESLFNSNIESQEHLLTKSTLEKIMESFITVTERQLADFLPGGTYGQTPDEETRNQMKHCKLTNLVGENEFGDLDYSQFKRRHASMHYHSGVEMVKRNKTISLWLFTKSEEEKIYLLELAKKKAKQLRDKHRSAEKEIMIQIKTRLEENYRKKQEMEAEKLSTMKRLVDDVKRHGGPCLNRRDVDKILQNCTTQSAKIGVLKNEFRYLKIILGLKDKRLLFGKKNVEALKLDLIMVLSSSETERVENDDAIVNDLSEQPNSISISKQGIKASYNFTRQGEWVAVAYDSDFYIGEVTNVYSDKLAQVQFLSKSLKNNFKWPQVDDVAKIENNFVIASDFG